MPDPTRDAEIEALATALQIQHGPSPMGTDPEGHFKLAEEFIDYRDQWRERRAEG